MGRGILGGNGCPIVKYRDTLRSSVQKTAEAIEMPFELWSRIGPRNQVSTGAKGRCHGNQFLAFDGYNFGCIASDTLFDSMGMVSGSSYPIKTSRDRVSKGCCHGNQFWDSDCYNWLYVNDSD